MVAVDIREPAGPLAPAVHWRPADVSQEEDCREAVQWTVDQYGGLDVLVNTAAIQPPESYVPVDQLPASLWDKMLAVNVSGYTFMAKHALRQMKQQATPRMQHASRVRHGEPRGGIGLQLRGGARYDWTQPDAEISTPLQA